MPKGADSVRLRGPLAKWADEWCDVYGHSKSQVLRAGLTLLVYAIDDLPPEAKMKFVAEYSKQDSIVQLRNPGLMASAAANLQSGIGDITKPVAATSTLDVATAAPKIRAAGRRTRGKQKGTQSGPKSASG